MTLVDAVHLSMLNFCGSAGVQSLSWEPMFFTANITFFGKKGGFNLFISKLTDETHKMDANSIKWLLKPIVKVQRFFQSLQLLFYC